MLCYDFSKNSQFFFRIYSGLSGSLYGSMSNFDGLFLLEFLSHRLQTLAQWNLGLGEVCYDYQSCSSTFIQDVLDYYVDQCQFNVVNVGRSPHEWTWLVNRGSLSEATPPTCNLWEPSTFNKLKYIGLYPIMFHCGASAAESCSALNQHQVFDKNRRTFQMLHFNIDLTDVIPSNTKRRGHVVLMIGQRRRQWYSIKPKRGQKLNYNSKWILKNPQ